MSLEAQLQAAVVTAFQKAGDLVAKVQLTRQVSGAYDPATGEPTVVESSYDFDGVVDEVKAASEIGSLGRASGGAEVETRAAKAFLRPGEVEPVQGDVLRIGERRHRVLSVLPIKPNGVTVLLWELRVAV